MCLPSDYSGGRCDKLFLFLQLNTALCSYIQGDPVGFGGGAGRAQAEQKGQDPVSGVLCHLCPHCRGSDRAKAHKKDCASVPGVAREFEGPGLAQTSQLKAAQSENKS